ncbi:MAG: winged helix-turn-helix domain-containing protein [Chloroflexi bacterium]|nr:winged helix-turn-helix domain-containing protein [Chloroflexota bacterium]
MDTPAEFRRSERHTLPVRLAVIIGVLSLGITTGASPAAIAALTIGFAVYTAILQFALLPRFRSDAWIYGMAGSDALFAGLAIAALGSPGPAIAIPVVFAVQHALFLGYRGAAVSASLGVLAALAGGIASGTGVLDALAATAPVIAGAAALSGYIAESRFSERSARRESERVHDADSSAARMLDGLRPVAAAVNEATALEAFARSVLTVTDFDAVAVYTRSGGYRLQMRVALTRDDATGPATPPAFQTDSGDEESMHGDSASARATSQGIALALGPGGLSSGRMPRWAIRQGYASGVVAPMTAGHTTSGIVFGLDRAETPVTLHRIDMMERFVSLAARLVATHGDGAQLAARNRLSLELDAAGRPDVDDVRPVIKMEGLTLDPATDRSSVGGVSVSLSRTEFDLLYALAESPGRVVDPGTLLESAFGDSSGSSQRTVDAAIYRLRRKLSRAPAGDDMIRTVRGKGYLLALPSTSGASEHAPDHEDARSAVSAD